MLTQLIGTDDKALYVDLDDIVMLGSLDSMDIGRQVFLRGGHKVWIKDSPDNVSRILDHKKR